MTKEKYLFPIRIPSYFTGALMINALCGAGRYRFDAAARPVILSLLKDVTPSGGDFPGKADLLSRTADAVATFRGESEAIIRAALDRNEVVLRGPAELVGVNVYNARSCGGFITSTYFLMYREGQENRMLQGDFVIKMGDEKTIDTVYRMA